MIVNALSFSEKGLVRIENQDVVFLAKAGETYLFVVADGMGGCANGKYASVRTIQHLKEWWEKLDNVIATISFCNLVDSLERSIHDLNSLIYNEYKKNGCIGGTTLDVLVVHKKQYAFINIGDSHIYCCSQKTCLQITTDDVWENSFRVRENRKLSDLKKDPRYGRLTNAVGSYERISFGVTTGEINQKTVFLMCTDGVYKFCKQGKIFRILKKIRKKDKNSQYLDQIKSEVYKNGAGDNLSAILIKMDLGE